MDKHPFGFVAEEIACHHSFNVGSAIIAIFDGDITRASEFVESESKRLEDYPEIAGTVTSGPSLDIARLAAPFGYALGNALAQLVDADGNPLDVRLAKATEMLALENDLNGDAKTKRPAAKRPAKKAEPKPAPTAEPKVESQPKAEPKVEPKDDDDTPADVSKVEQPEPKVESTETAPKKAPAKRAAKKTEPKVEAQSEPDPKVEMQPQPEPVAQPEPQPTAIKAPAGAPSAPVDVEPQFDDSDDHDVAAPAPSVPTLNVPEPDFEPPLVKIDAGSFGESLDDEDAVVTTSPLSAEADF